MKNRLYIVLLLFSTVIVLAACSADAAEQVDALSVQPTCIVDEPQEDITETYVSSVNLSLNDLIFIYNGDMVLGSGDEMQWYYTIFGANIINISGFFIDFVGDIAFHEWTQQFSGHGINAHRNSREANLLAFIEDFGLTMSDLIMALEVGYGKPMHEIDERVMWGRYGVHSSEEEANAHFWAMSYSLSDLEALFSNDVYALWAAFPGTGVVHNGRAYSPEWILHNMNSAIMYEQIPIIEIERILEHATHFTQLDEIREMAESTFHAVR